MSFPVLLALRKLTAKCSSVPKVNFGLAFLISPSLSVAPDLIFLFYFLKEFLTFVFSSSSTLLETARYKLYITPPPQTNHAQSAFLREWKNFAER